MSDLSKWKVHGPVRMLKTEFAEWDSSQGQWGPPKGGITVCAFRPDGKISETEGHNSDGSIAHAKWLYDGGGRLVERQFWMNDEPPAKALYFYDDAERHVRTVEVNREGTQRESECYKYDSRGWKTQVRFLPPQKPNMHYAYGVEGTETSLDATGAATMTVTYDEGDQPTEVLFHDADQHLIRRVALVRDHEGRLMRVETYLGEQLPFPKLPELLERASPEDRARATELFSMFFDPRRAFAEEATEETSREVGIDEQGELRTASENSRKWQARFEYTYDANGNWIERAGSIRYDRNPEFQRPNVERREIRYYEN